MMKKEVDALARLYEYMLWLIPKLENFPRSQKYLLGDRMETLVLDIMDLLIEATYTRNKGLLLELTDAKLQKIS